MMHQRLFRFGICSSKRPQNDSLRFRALHPRDAGRQLRRQQPVVGSLDS